jgi:dTDP-4-amino-4,6-dideoxygalactose transaminase
MVGSFGDAAAFSFCQDKIITTGGEGGMLTTNQEDVWRKAWEYKDHGKSYQAVFETEHPAGFRWLHESFGTNWRLTEMQAALGRVALKKLPSWLALRRKYAGFYNEGFLNSGGLRVTIPHDHIEHAYYKYYTFVVPHKFKNGITRDDLMKKINAKGVPCFSGSCSEIYLEKAFANAGLGPSERLPIARELGETSLMFLLHPTLEQKHIEKTIDVVNKVIDENLQ